MRKLFNLNTNRTLLLDLMMGGETPDKIIAECRNAEHEGADGIAFELSMLKPEFRNKKSFESIINSVDLPFMVIFYRNDLHQEKAPSDDARQKILLEAVEAGAGMVDVMGDLYDPNPDQRAKDKKAIKKQMKLIDRIHAAGAQVIMSSHPMRVMSDEEVLDQLKDFEKRGADVVKLVATANTDQEFKDMIGTFMRLHRELTKPFVYLANGKFGRIQRFAGLSLGQAITFGVHSYRAGEPYNQPRISDFKAVQNAIHWNIHNY